MDTFEKVSAMIAEQLNIDKNKITPESEFVKDLGADSLDVVEMLLDLEKEYGIDISGDDTTDLKTVGEIVALIDKR